ncbi:Nn.00g096930.m01.CDS01 [Neocucurbitaria sp. VM-36]
MSEQNAMSDAKQRVQKALQTFPTNRAVQVKDKTFYEHILIQVRAVLSKKQTQLPENHQELRNLITDISALEEVVAVKTDYIAFLDQHMNAFQEGLAKGAKANEGKAMHWDAEDLIKYVEDDEKVYLEKIGGFKVKWEVATNLVNPEWLKAFGEMYVVAGKNDDDELVEGIKGLDLKMEKGEEAKEMGAERVAGQSKGPGRLKGKARKEAKKAAAAKK